MAMNTCECGCGQTVGRRFVHGHNARLASLKHGHACASGRSREHVAWGMMIQRCYNQNKEHYARYGGRGIQVCPEWLDSFEAFFAYVGQRPIGHTLDRIDNDGNYEPGNVRWASRKDQMHNTYRAMSLSFNGVTMSLHDWATTLGISENTLRMRIQRGWTVDRILTTAVARTDVEPESGLFI